MSYRPEQAPHIDKTDFLNAVVREKKRFENTLDDCVASGLNAGTQVLMNQVRSRDASIAKRCDMIDQLSTFDHDRLITSSNH